MKRVSFPGPEIGFFQVVFLSIVEKIPGIAPQLYKGEESPSNQNTNQETERYNKAHKEIHAERSKTERGREIPALALLAALLISGLYFSP